MRFLTKSRKGAVEARSGYSGLVLAGFEAEAHGDGNRDPRHTAALEVAAGLWSRALSMATGGEPYLTPSVLAHIGRALVRGGECVCIVSPGEVLQPAVLVNVHGGADPASWRYVLDVVGPTKTETRYLAASEVVHFRYAYRVDQPWRGVAPWQWARVSAGAAANIEALARDEAGIPAGYLVQEGGNMNDLQFERFSEALQNIRGRINAFMNKKHPSTGGELPFKAERIGGNPPDSINVLRNDSAVQLLAACGVHPGLVGIERGEGTASREQWRQFLYATIEPVARLAIADELDAKLDTGIRLAFDDLAASDIQGRARAYGTLTKGGMDKGKAARLCGFD
ncbi:MAG: phage portal protein [Gammaproteobacteria bacterium]|nr:phage portal protein [Gammaproteobacteria bacterium]